MKRASEGLNLSATSIGLLVISALLIFIAIKFIYGAGTVLAGGDSQGTQESFNSLVALAGSISVGTIESQPYFIEDNFHLFGFNKGASPAKGEEIVPRWDDCSPLNSCFCICDNNKCDGDVRECKPFEGDDNVLQILVHKDTRNNQGQILDSPHKYLALAGKTGALWWGNSWGSRQIYMKKVGVSSYTICLSDDIDTFKPNPTDPPENPPPPTECFKP